MRFRADLAAFRFVPLFTGQSAFFAKTVAIVRSAQPFVPVMRRRARPA
jgi:hypothetical protein